MNKLKSISFTILFSSLTAALGAFLLGYHTGIISGALLFMTREFSLTMVQSGIVVSMTLLGAVLGAISSGIADRLGRKLTLFLALFLYLIGTLGLIGLEIHYSTLLWGRLIVGYAVGITSVVVPLYIAEISPPQFRGALVSLNQLMVTLGLLVSFGIAYLHADAEDWRSMIGFSLIPACLQLGALFFIPETPHWLMSRNRLEAAEQALHRLQSTSPGETLLVQEKKEDRPVKQTLRDLLTSSARKPFLIGIGISLFQQITGINTVMYYAPIIFQSAGFVSPQSALYATILVGLINVAMTVVGLGLIDRLGRRPLALWGLAGMGCALALLGSAFVFHLGDGFLAIVSVLIYVAFFAPGLGIVTWLLISEIYPLGIRAQAMGVASVVNWGSNFLIAFTFLPLIQLITIGGVYWLYASFCAVGFYFMWRSVPETKGKTFQEIQQFWQR